MTDRAVDRRDGPRCDRNGRRWPLVTDVVEARESPGALPDWGIPKEPLVAALRVLLEILPGCGFAAIEK